MSWFWAGAATGHAVVMLCEHGLVAGWQRAILGASAWLLAWRLVRLGLDVLSPTWRET